MTFDMVISTTGCTRHSGILGYLIAFFRQKTCISTVVLAIGLSTEFAFLFATMAAIGEEIGKPHSQRILSLSSNEEEETNTATVAQTIADEASSNAQGLNNNDSSRRPSLTIQRRTSHVSTRSQNLPRRSTASANATLNCDSSMDRQALWSL
ncbi:hypothetical protein BDB00DRAFT_875040 [Zychaea mexicana]|uniref:uncharacterized protein n=1 Tax=Zychaea mexicana TaxID=64656 RepID=UPI0022FE9024|nr:uncharacterized protein BDB00DRAFT_875040 [Zychaea mexicana]KAI9490708.1 hypothetical protein BDB00DRAFT_875040 [Zychaea mexicana]